MDSSEFFITETDSSPWGTSETTRLHTELLDQLATGPSSTWSDLDVAKALAELTHDEYQKYGTSGSELDNAEARKLLTTIKAVLARIGMRNVEFGFRDFDRFRSYWIRKGASGSGGWQARRDLLAELFNPIHDRIESLVAGGSGPKVTEEALSTLEAPGAIRDHLERIERNLDDDPRLAGSGHGWLPK